VILDTFRLDGKIALVTGASRGIGRAIAIALAEAGADVALAARGSLDASRDAVLRAGRRAACIAQDVAAPGAPARIVQACVSALGGLDILVNNAGITRRAPVTDVSEQDWDAVTGLNQKALFFLAQAAARQMITQGRGGKIINIASILSFQGGVLIAPYTASKGAVRTLTMLLANELAPHNIQVNALAPGYIATDINQPLRDDPRRSRQILERIPAGRWGEPEDLQGACVFLASSASRYMTGATLVVDGGWLGR
jgi:2-deoxy-D-gluconate 3-dehydrogenase